MEGPKPKSFGGAYPLDHEMKSQQENRCRRWLLVGVDYFKGSAAAADPLVGQVPLVVDMTLRWVDMTLQEKILGGQNLGSWWFSGPGTFKKRFPVKNDVEWYPQK